MARNCKGHPGNVSTILCETCEKQICQDCHGHDQHEKIQLKSVDKAYAELNLHNRVNKLKKLERDVQQRTDLVVAEVNKAGKSFIEELAAARKKEIEIVQSIEKIQNGTDSTPEKYLKIKKVPNTSKTTPRSKLEFIQSHYLLKSIPKIIGRLERVVSGQELVELTSFNTYKRKFIKSICIVDELTAWILHYRETTIHLVDYDGKILETRELGEPVEDFCMTRSGDVFYTIWNGHELKKSTKDNNSLSMHNFGNSYVTRGLCFKGEDVMVCLCSTRAGQPNRLVKMSLSESTARELVFTSNDFFEPGRVTYKASSRQIIAVVDWNDAGRIVKAVDNDGKCLWKWEGQLDDSSKLSPFLPFDISFCNINETKRFLITLQGHDWNKVCSIDLQGRDAKCIYTASPYSCDGAIAMDPNGRVWIGDQIGTVHILAAIHVD